MPRLASAVVAYKHYLIIYGGFGGVSSSYNQSAENVNDMWCYDTHLQSWAKIDFQLDVVHLPDHSLSTDWNLSPLALFGMTSSIVQEEWFLFGGEDDRFVPSSSLYRVSLADVVNQASFLFSHNTSASLPNTIISKPLVVSMSLLSWGVTGAPPSPREVAQVIVSDDSRLFVYSGHCSTKVCEDMYVLDLVTQTWTNISSIPSLPAGRLYATFTWIDEYHAALYGSADNIDDTVYLFSIPRDRNSFNFTWTALTTNSSDSPIARKYHMAASLNGLLFIVGGYGTADYLILNDTWSFSRVEGWTRLADITYPYTALDGMVAFNDKLYTNFYSGQVSQFDPKTNTWSSLPFANDFLSVYENGGIANFGSSVYVVDGDASQSGLSEFAVFDLVLQTVSHPYTPSFSTAVAPRTFITNSFVCQRSLPRCFLFGGRATNGSLLNDLNILTVDNINIDIVHGSDIGCVQSPTTPCQSLSGAVGYYSTSFLLPPLQFSLVQYTVHAINSTHPAILDASFLSDVGLGAIVINEPVLIQPSDDGPAFILDCQGGRCLNINGATVTLQGFTVQNAGQTAVQVTQGGALTLQNMNFKNNAGVLGGAIYLDSSSDLVAMDSHFSFHSAYQGGVIFASSLSMVHAERCTFSDNAVSAGYQHIAAYGGAIYAVSGSNISLSYCQFLNNTAVSSGELCGLGGAVFLLTSFVSVSDCIFMNNNACNGGAIASIGVTATNITDVSSLLSSYSLLLIQNSSLSLNKALSTGGAIYASAVDVISLSYSNFTANSAHLHGAAVYSDSKNLTTFNVSACIFEHNNCTGGAGGGIFWNPPPFAAPLSCSFNASDNNTAFFQSQPVISNMSPQESNSAGYGPWLASPPICSRLKYVNVTATNFSDVNQFDYTEVVRDPSLASSYFRGLVSSATPLPLVTVELVDAFHNLVVGYDSLTVVQATLSSNTNNTVSLTGSLTSATHGTATFDHLVLSGSPGQNASITFQSTMLGRVVFTTPNLFYIIKPCPVGFYLDANQCLNCPTGTYSFSVNSPQCTVCADNVDCNHAFIARQGWWVYQLPNEMGVVPCLPTLCVGGHQCAGARPDPSTNALCGRCLPGFSWWHGDCVVCPPIVISLLLFVLLISIVYVVVSRYFSLTSSCEIGIFTYYAQMVSLLFRSASSSSWLSVFNLSPAQMGVACFFNLEYYADIATNMLSPFLLCVVLAVIMCLHYVLLYLPIPLLSSWLLSQDKARVTSRGIPMSFIGSYVRAFIYLAVSGYQGITSVVITSLLVVSVSTSTSDNHGNLVTTTSRLLYEYPAVDADSSSYRILFAFAVLLAICIVAGLPLVLFFVLAVIRPHSMQPRIVARYGGLYEAYSLSPFGYYNSVWMLLRRTIIVSVFQFLLSSQTYQLTVVTILFICICMIHNYGSPNVNNVDNMIEAVSHFSLAVISCLLSRASLISPSPSISSDSAHFIIATLTLSILGVYVFVSKAIKFKAVAEKKLELVIGKNKKKQATETIKERERDRDEQTPHAQVQGTHFHFVDNPIAKPDYDTLEIVHMNQLDVRVHEEYPHVECGERAAGFIH